MNPQGHFCDEHPNGQCLCPDKTVSAHTGTLQPQEEIMVETKLWTAWIHYFATGEGVTYMAIIDYATTPEEIKQKFTERFGEYSTIGCEVGVGVIRNGVTKLLFSEELMARLEGNENISAALSASGEYHVNKS